MAKIPYPSNTAIADYLRPYVGGNTKQLFHISEIVVLLLKNRNAKYNTFQYRSDVNRIRKWLESITKNDKKAERIYEYNKQFDNALNRATDHLSVSMPAVYLQPMHDDEEEIDRLYIDRIRNIIAKEKVQRVSSNQINSEPAEPDNKTIRMLRDKTGSITLYHGTHRAFDDAPKYGGKDVLQTGFVSLTENKDLANLFASEGPDSRIYSIDIPHEEILDLQAESEELGGKRKWKDLSELIKKAAEDGYTAVAIHDITLGSDEPEYRLVKDINLKQWDINPSAGNIKRYGKTGKILSQFNEGEQITEKDYKRVLKETKAEVKRIKRWLKFLIANEEDSRPDITNEKEANVRILKEKEKVLAELESAKIIDGKVYKQKGDIEMGEGNTKYTHQAPDYLMGDDGKMYRIEWKQAAAMGGLTAAGATAGYFLGDNMGAAYATGLMGMASIPVTKKWIEKYKKDTGKSPEIIQGDDGKMYRIEWKEAAAIGGLTAAGAAAGYFLGDGVGPAYAAGLTGMVTIPAAKKWLSKKKYKHELPEYMEDADGKMYRVDWKQTGDTLQYIAMPITGAVMGGIAGHMLGGALMGYPDGAYPNEVAGLASAGMALGLVGGFAAANRLKNKRETKKMKEQEMEDNPPAMYRAMPDPQPIMPPSIITPAFGGKSRPKPPGFMPRMPGQRRRR